MKNQARIDVSKEVAKGISFGDTVTLKLTGKVDGIETWDTMTPVELEENGKEKKTKKEEPKVTIKVSDYSVSVNGEPEAKKVFNKKFNEELEKE